MWHKIKSHEISDVILETMKFLLSAEKGKNNEDKNTFSEPNVITNNDWTNKSLFWSWNKLKRKGM